MNIIYIHSVYIYTYIYIYLFILHNLKKVNVQVPAVFPASSKIRVDFGRPGDPSTRTADLVPSGVGWVGSTMPSSRERRDRLLLRAWHFLVNDTDRFYASSWVNSKNGV